jgi:hypothetical protein
MSPIVILFHAAFQSNNMVATLSYVSVLLVVSSGIVGRFVYGLIPVEGGRYLEAEELRSRIEQLAHHLNPYLERIGKPQVMHGLLQRVTLPIPPSRSYLFSLLSIPLESLNVRGRIQVCHRFFSNRFEYRDFRRTILRLMKMRRQQYFFRRMKRFLSWWRAIHVVLAIFLVVVIALHIYASTRLGYRWIF